MRVASSHRILFCFGHEVLGERKKFRGMPHIGQATCRIGWWRGQPADQIGESRPVIGRGQICNADSKRCNMKCKRLTGLAVPSSQAT